MKYKILFVVMFVQFLTNSAFAASPSLFTQIGQCIRDIFGRSSAEKESTEVPKATQFEPLSFIQPKNQTLTDVLTELKAQNMNSPAAQLIESFTEDVFQNFDRTGKKPFLPLRDLQPVHRLIGRGIERFERSSYVSVKNLGQPGYDVVVYRIYHLDGTHSVVQAAKQSVNANPFDVMPGFTTLDLRDVQVLMYVSIGEGKMTQYRFVNGSFEGEGTGGYQQGIDFSGQFVTDSLLKGGMKEFSNKP